MSLIEKYIREEHPDINFTQLTADDINRMANTLSFSCWKLKQASNDLKNAVAEWVNNCKL